MESRAMSAKLMCAVMAIFAAFGTIRAAQYIQFPQADVYVITYGGGEGCNAFLKFNIAGLPAVGAVIDSAFLFINVIEQSVDWDGDVKFWNVHNQTWTESDSTRILWESLTSDTLLQSSGFLDGGGSGGSIARSVDIKSIIDEDYSLHRQYCTIKLKDPDDRTMMPAPNTVPINNDTLKTGNRLPGMGGVMSFYPREDANRAPRLVVYYHLATGITRPLSSSEKTPFGARAITSASSVQFLVNVRKHGAFLLLVYDVCGREVWSHCVNEPVPGENHIVWNAGLKMSNGCYLVTTQQADAKAVTKLQLVK